MTDRTSMTVRILQILTYFALSNSFQYKLHNVVHHHRRPRKGVLPPARVLQVDDDSSDATEGDPAHWYRSHISEIKSYNLAGLVHPNYEDIEISLGSLPNLVAVTGETGSGKSILIAKLADIVTGGKAMASFVPTVPHNKEEPMGENQKPLNQASVEMVLHLSEPHLSAVKESFERVGLDPSLLLSGANMDGDDNDDQTCRTTGTLVLKRTLFVGNSRLKSSCEINGSVVTLKTLKTIAAPLVAIVDAPAAAAALAKPGSRMAIVDTAVSPPLLINMYDAKTTYRACLKRRERLQRELESRVLPPSYSPIDSDGDGDGDDRDLELLQHWIDEFDEFELRMVDFCKPIAVTSDTRNDPTFHDIVLAVTSSSWTSGENEDSSASLYANLVEFREAIKTLDAQIELALNACESLGSLSAPDSAATALQRARDSIYDAVGGSSDNDGPVSGAAERAHDLLNKIEGALEDCVKAIEDDSQGLIQVLESTRSSIDVPIEQIDEIIMEWNVLARKHGISPYVLPSCHRALKCELDGNVEARLLLPKALEEERVALLKFEDACAALINARQSVANTLSSSVRKRLPSLGMDTSMFEARLNGLDSVDFLLVHGQKNNNKMENEDASSSQRGGRIDVVASAGEKARILLAIETELPGSIGASCGSSDRITQQVNTNNIGLPPVAVIYDEIDAHVGGRAAVSLANMLADQTREGTGTSRVREQVISITHSPSVAAIADVHLVIQKVSDASSTESHIQKRTVPVLASTVEGADRRKELARMASGDLATDEAEIFADALIRDGIRQRNLMS